MASLSQRLATASQKNEPKNQYIDSGDRPDIMVYDTEIGANVELAFSLAHPFSSGTVVRASKEDRFVAAKREKK